MTAKITHLIRTIQIFSAAGMQILQGFLSAVSLQIVIFSPRCWLLLARYINVDTEGSGLVPVGVRLEKKVNKNNGETNTEMGGGKNKGAPKNNRW